VAYYREARAQYGYDSAALQRLAALKMATGASKDAIRLYEAGLQQDPDHVEYYGGLAVAHHFGDNPSRAIVQSSRAIQAGIDPALARKTVAKAYMEYGLYDQALGELSNSLTYAPADTEARVLVARCLRSRGNLQRAIETLREAAVGAPHSIDIKYELALCLRNAQEYAAAEEVISGVLGAPEAPPRVYLLAATISANQGDARRQAERAALAIEAGDETGWGWFISARAVPAEQAAESYENAANHLAQTAQAASRTESASAFAGVAACRSALGSPQEAARAAIEARKKLAGEHYVGEPVFSPTLLRGIPGTEFTEELKAYEQ
jgi:tetratricopeptide (TPR) repeat protein